MRILVTFFAMVASIAMAQPGGPGSGGGSSGSIFSGYSQILLDPPHVGPSATLPGYNPQALSPGFCHTTGAGIVREIYIVPDIAGTLGMDAANGTNVHLQIWCDHGSGTNGISTNFLTVDLPMAYLLGTKYRFASNGPYAVIRDSALIFSCAISTNSMFGGPVFNVSLTAGMPFSNGFVAKLVQTTNGGSSQWQGGYMQVHYEPATSLSALGSYSSWRFRSGAYYGTPPSGTNTLFRRAGKPAALVGLMASYLSNTGTDFSDTVEPVFQTSATTTWVWSGYSDFWKDPYSMSTGVNAGSLGHWGGNTVGTINAWYIPAASQPGGGFTKYIFETYRWFIKDPIMFDSHGMDVIQWNAEQTCAQDLLFFYYSP